MVERFEITPVEDGHLWTYSLRAADDEVLAIAVRRLPRREDCEALIAEVFNRYEFDLTVRQRNDGRWSWEMSKSGRPLLTSPRTHALPTHCGSAMRRVKRLIEDLSRTRANAIPGQASSAA